MLNKHLLMEQPYASFMLKTVSPATVRKPGPHSAAWLLLTLDISLPNTQGSIPSEVERNPSNTLSVSDDLT